MSQPADTPGDGQEREKKPSPGTDPSRPDADSKPPPEESGDADGAGKDEGSKGFRVSKKAIIIAGLGLVIFGVAGVLYYLHARQFVSTDDAYTAGHVHQVSSRIAGTVARVRVEDNQRVRTGDVLVQLDPRDMQVALQQTQAALLQAKAQAVQSEAKIAQAHGQLSAAQAQVAQAQSQVTQARAQLARALADYDRIAGLYSRDIKAVSKADVDQATEAFTRAKGQLEGSRADLTARQAQAESATADVQAARADADAARANIAASQAQVRNAELQLSYCQVLAPAEGKVSKKTVEKGQRLQPGQALLAIVPDDVWVIANLKETQLARLRVGQRVDLKIDALAEQTFAGSVQSIQEGSGATFSLLPPDNATGNFTKIVQRVPVKIVFDEESIRDFRDRLVPGLSVLPKIDLESLHDKGREAKRQDRVQEQNRDAESGQ